MGRRSHSTLRETRKISTCETRGGKPKAVFRNRERADREIEKRGYPLRAYSCAVHGGWHIGHVSLGR
jgi:hypothetical protein